MSVKQTLHPLILCSISAVLIEVSRHQGLMTLLQHSINNAKYLKITYFYLCVTDCGNYFGHLLGFGLY